MTEQTRPMGVARSLRALLAELMKLRMQQGKTLTETAAAVRVTRQSLTAWEEGKTFPTLPNIFLWAKFLGKTITLADIPQEPTEPTT